MAFLFKNTLKFVLCLSLASCATTTDEKKFSTHLEKGNCEEALLDLPTNTTSFKLMSMAKETSGTIFSYSATGAAYTAQIVWDVVAGVTTVTLICAPFFAAALASHSGISTQPGGSLQPYCFPVDGVNLDSVMSPPLGKNTYHGTKSWRCPDVKPLSEAVRKVAKCFGSKSDERSKEKAYTTLKSIGQSSEFYSCLPNEEINAYQADLAAAKAAANKE